MYARMCYACVLCDNGDDVTALCVAENCDALEYLLNENLCLGDVYAPAILWVRTLYSRPLYRKL